MAKSPGGSSVLLPIAIVAVVVAAILVGVFALGDDAPPDQATIISEDIDAEPTEAGTMEEGNTETEEEGVTDELDEVEPAAEGEDSIPAQDAQSGDAQSGSEAEQPEAPEEATGTSSDASEATGDEPRPAASLGEEDSSASDDYLLDESSDAPAEADVDRATEEDGEGLPEGRDARTELTPSDCQEIVQDTDDGGAPVIPTPSGPNGNTGDCVESAQ